MSTPLQGIKVLDFTGVQSGPSCTQMLAWFGADVIKIERPGVGDVTRHQLRDIPDIDALYFTMLNSNKRSIELNTKTAEGKEVMEKLIREADILVENFHPGAIDHMGFTWEHIQEINPRLIYASLTGFGQTGPDSAKPGYDYIIQGLSGLMSITGPSDGLPHKVGVAVVDLFAGLQLTVGIQAALLARAKTGLGQHVDVSLLDSAIAMTANVGMNYLSTGEVPPRLGNEHPNIVPYQVFEVAQEQHLILACGNDTQFAAVCRVMQQDWDMDERFARNPLRVQNRQALIPMMQQAFLSKTRDEWLSLFEAAGVPCGPINNIAEALSMPQVEHRHMVIDFAANNSPVRMLGSPLHLSSTPVQYRSAPPKIGQDTDEVLSQRYSVEQLAQFKDTGVI